MKETWQHKFLKAGTENGCGDLSIMIKTVSDIRQEEAEASREEENQAWLSGMRCYTCGKEMQPTGLTDTCADCFENN